MDETTAWMAIAGGAVATYFWRALGVALSGRVQASGPLFEWIACTAYGLLAGLIARMILLPVGPLQEATLSARAGSALLGLAVFFLFKRNLVGGMISGLLSLIVWIW